MTDKVKLIIEIPKKEYEAFKALIAINMGGRCSGKGIIQTCLNAVKNGIPLDDVKAEIKAMFPPSGDWMYDEECEHEHTVCEVLSDVLHLLDNIGGK